MSQTATQTPLTEIPENSSNYPSCKVQISQELAVASADWGYDIPQEFLQPIPNYSPDDESLELLDESVFPSPREINLENIIGQHAHPRAGPNADPRIRVYPRRHLRY